MTKEEALKLVQEEGHELENLPDHFKKDREIVLEAVRQSGYALKHADDSVSRRTGKMLLGGTTSVFPDKFVINLVKQTKN